LSKVLLVIVYDIPKIPFLGEGAFRRQATTFLTSHALPASVRWSRAHSRSSLLRCSFFPDSELCLWSPVIPGSTAAARLSARNCKTLYFLSVTPILNDALRITWCC